MIGIDEIRVLVVMVELFLALFLLELTSFDVRQFWLCVGSRPGCVLLFFLFFFVLLTTGRR